MAVREEKIVIRVSGDMKDSFQSLAESMGMTMSGLGAFLIGNYTREENYKREMQEKLLEQVTPQFLDRVTNIDFSDPTIAKALESTIAKLTEQNRP